MRVTGKVMLVVECNRDRGETPTVSHHQPQVKHTQPLPLQAASRTRMLTCIVTSLSSTMTSFVRKSAPIVALYWLLNRLFTNWFISDVLPTPLSPRMITCERVGEVSVDDRGRGAGWWSSVGVWVVGCEGGARAGAEAHFQENLAP